MYKSAWTFQRKDKKKSANKLFLVSHERFSRQYSSKLSHADWMDYRSALLTSDFEFGTAIKRKKMCQFFTDKAHVIFRPIVSLCSAPVKGLEETMPTGKNSIKYDRSLQHQGTVR